MRSKIFTMIAVVMILGPVCTPLRAQPGGYPTKPIRVLVPF